ncbi:hypothetical protein B0H11DRAFT_2204692 [Mycena galericulata]|nr:hypothetical protein B0H11DRAFT_2204692 [Mycena galericulata]
MYAGDVEKDWKIASSSEGWTHPELRLLCNTRESITPRSKSYLSTVHIMEDPTKNVVAIRERVSEVEHEQRQPDNGFGDEDSDASGKTSLVSPTHRPEVWFIDIIRYTGSCIHLSHNRVILRRRTDCIGALRDSLHPADGREEVGARWSIVMSSCPNESESGYRRQSRTSWLTARPANIMKRKTSDGTVESSSRYRGVGHQQSRGLRKATQLSTVSAVVMYFVSLDYCISPNNRYKHRFRARFLDGRLLVRHTRSSHYVIELPHSQLLQPCG